MGYCIELVNSDFEFTNEAGALDALKRLGSGSDDPRARGGEWSGQEKVRSWFSWVDADFSAMKTLDEAMAAWRYPIVRNDVGEVVSLDFSGEKIGQEELMFEAIAPFVREGSTVEMLGEDGERWRWVFQLDKYGQVQAVEQAARVSYE